MDFLTCLLIDCAKKAKHNLSKALEKYKVTCRQAVVLRSLNQSSCTAKEIGESTTIDKATLSAMLQKLIENKMVDFHAGDRDGREKIYSLTEKGKTLLPKIMEVEDDFKKKMLANLNEEEYQKLSAFLVSIKENL